MDLTEKQQCVLCDKGGNLLVCNSDGCPISVHKNCMGCEARLDDSGNFNCPYCVYKRLTAETGHKRSKVMLTKKALSTFLEEEMKDENQHESPIVGMDNKEEEISSKNNENCDDDRNRCVNLKKEINVNTCMIMVVYEPKLNHVESCDLDCNSYKEDVMKDDQIESNVNKKMKIENRTGKTTCIEEEVVKSKSADIWSTIDKKITRKKRKRSVAFNKNRTEEECMMENAARTLESLQKGNQLQSKLTKIDPDVAKKGSLETNNINISKPEEVKDSSKQQLKPNNKIGHKDSDSLLDQPNGEKKESLETKKINVGNSGELKDSTNQLPVTDSGIKLQSEYGKHRVLWSPEEEDMLKEGVQKFSATTRKNLPWKKILEFGRDVFASSRNPSDLKDKWRKIAKQNLQ